MRPLSSVRAVAPFIRAVALSVLAASCLLPAAGCGGGAKPKKKGGLTIAQRIERAEAEKTPEKQARALVEVARLQLRSQDRSGALATLGKARQRIPDDAEAAVRGPRFVEVAAVYAELGDKPLAKDAIGKALEAGDAIDDPVAKAGVLADAAAVQGSKTTGLGEPAAARRTIEKARAAADAAEGQFKAKALAAVATGCLAAGLVDEAGKLVTTLEESARALEEGRPKVEALVAAANVHIEQKAAAAATPLLDEAAAGARAIDGNENRAYALVSVALATHAAGDKKAALALLKEAEKAAAKVGDPDAQKNAAERVRAAQAEVEKKKK